MTLFRVVKDGETVWQDESDETSVEHFPKEHRGRPDSGAVELWIGDELIAVNIPLADEEAQIAAASAAEGEV